MCVDRYFNADKFQECLIQINTKMKNKQRHNYMLVNYDNEINMQVFESFSRVIGCKDMLNSNNSNSDDQIEGSNDYVLELLH